MPADVVFRVGRAYGMTADRAVYQAVAVTDGRITAAERSRDDLDSFIGPGTTVIDDPELVLYPAFADTHNHQLMAARDLDYVALDQAHSIDELVQALRDAATRLMFWVMPQATVADTLAYVDSLPPPGSVPGYGGGLGIWGLKVGMDGGVE